MRANTAISDLFKHSEHLKICDYNYMAWCNLIRVDLVAVDAYEIVICKKLYPIGAGCPAAIRVRHKTRKPVGKRLGAIHSGRADTFKLQISYIDNLNCVC